MKPSKSRLVITVALILVVCGCVGLKADDERVQAGVEAAEAWLQLVDQGGYDKSWEETAAYFRAAVGREQWQQTMTAARQPLGEVESRELLEAKYRSQLAGAPDGDYVVIRFKTSFSNKAESVETITPMLDPDGRWRVSGYYIK